VYGLNRSLGLAIGAIALIALVSSAALLGTLNGLGSALDARGRSYEILSELDAFRVAMLNQETGLRGYLLSGDRASLAPYRTGIADLVKTIGRLRELVADNPEAVERLTAAELAARDWQTTIAEPVIADMAHPETRGRAKEIGGSDDARRRFDRFRADLASIQTGEEQLLTARQAATERARRVATGALWIGAILTLLICAAIGWAVRRRVSGPILQLATAMRRLAQRDLAIDVPSTHQRNEVGEMARAVEVFKTSMIELDRTSLLRVTADTIPALVGYVDASRRIGFLNGEFGRWFDLHVDDVSQVYGRSLDDVFASAPFPGADRELNAALEGAEERFEHRLVRRGEEFRDVEAIYRPHRASDGTILGVVTLLTDITERKELDRRLTQQASDLTRSNEELEQFAYVASHDLRAPLRGIKNLVSWIEEELEQALTGDTRTNLKLLNNRVQRLESLLDNLLEYARAGRQVESVELVDTRALVAELASLLNPPKGFRITAAAALPTLNAPRAPLTQVLQNLINNAIKHHENPSNGHVWVDARPRPGGVEFIVSDDGSGVPPAYRSRVFGMFQTLKPRDEVEGSGMGLAIVKKLVERYHGEVWLDDGPDGRGLAVHFTWTVDVAGRPATGPTASGNETFSNT
jgi:PAS domain S-box-containing protein